MQEVASMARTKRRYLETPAKAEIMELPAIIYSVGIYSRLSVDHDDKKSESIENQIEMIRQYITVENKNRQKRQKFEIYDIYIDRGISGTSFAREGFCRLMDDVRNHNVNCIIVKDLSRFGRDYLETGNYIEKIFPFLGVRFIAVTDGYDSMSENASDQKLAMNIKNLVNDMYAKDISKRVMTARKAAAWRGAYIGSITPYGYTIEERNGIRKLVIHPENAEIVSYLFQSYASGSSYREMSAYLYQKKVHRISDFNQYGHTYWRKGETLHQWNPSSIRSVLSNPVYTGKLVQCGRTLRLQEGQEEQSARSHAGETEWITVENAHEPIIAQELFDQVSARLNKRSKEGFNEIKEKAADYRQSGSGEMADDENIFRHILYCGNCGGKMHTAYYQSRVNGKRSYSYYCRNAYDLDGKRCSKNCIKEEQLERCCFEQMKQVLEKNNLSSQVLIDRNHIECKKVKAVYLKEQSKIMQEKQRLSAQAAALYMQYKEGSVSSQEYSSFRKNRAEHENFCAKRMEELNRKIRKCEIQAEEQDQFLRSLQRTDGCKKQNIWLITSLIEKIAVSSEGVIDIWFRFQKEEEQ